MSKKAKKEKPLTGNAARELLHGYMCEQNRPFNVQMLLLNLHKRIGKAELTRQLETMTAEGLAVRKQYGRQVVYWNAQKELERASLEELRAYDAKLKELRDECAQLKGENKRSVARNKALASGPTNDGADTVIGELERELEELRGRVAALQAGAADMSDDAREKLEKRYANAKLQWRKRRRIVYDIVDQLKEQGNLTMNDLKDDPGLETDQDYGADLNAESQSAKRRRLLKSQ
jgi:26S proteasome regulatory subunit, ATPase 3, interacting protein